MSARERCVDGERRTGRRTGAAAMLHAAIADALRQARARLEQRDFAGPAGSTKAC